jgi:hypothetical protein
VGHQTANLTYKFCPKCGLKTLDTAVECSACHYDFQVGFGTDSQKATPPIVSAATNSRLSARNHKRLSEYSTAHLAITAAVFCVFMICVTYYLVEARRMNELHRITSMADAARESLKSISKGPFGSNDLEKPKTPEQIQAEKELEALNLEQLALMARQTNRHSHVDSAHPLSDQEKQEDQKDNKRSMEIMEKLPGLQRRMNP